MADHTAKGAVVSYLQSQAIRHIAVTPNSDFILFHAPVSVVESLFEAIFYRFVQGGTKRVYYRSKSHSVPPPIRRHVDLVAHVSDLPSAESRFASYAIRAASQGANQSDGVVTPQTLFQEYAIKQVGGGAQAHTPVGVFEIASYYAPRDLVQYLTMYGLPTPHPLPAVHGANVPSACSNSSINYECDEASLDLQLISAICQNASLQVWDEANSNATPFYSWLLSLAALPSPPPVQSASYAQPEALGTAAGAMARVDMEFAKLGARGVTIMFASGDFGCAGQGAWHNASNCGFNPTWPSSSAFVTAVGATQLRRGKAGDGEVACQMDQKPFPADITTGGGFGQATARPVWQQQAVAGYLATAFNMSAPPAAAAWPSLQFPAQKPNLGGRGYPDLSALGHNIMSVVGGVASPTDGTSASTPIVAAMFALVNAARGAEGQPPLGFVNPLLYHAARTAPSVFHDVAAGNNACTGITGICCPHGFDGAPGWDPVTGLGSLNLTAFRVVAANAAARVRKA